MLLVTFPGINLASPIASFNFHGVVSARKEKIYIYIYIYRRLLRSVIIMCVEFRRLFLNLIELSIDECDLGG